jgi:hypothetical protein
MAAPQVDHGLAVDRRAKGQADVGTARKARRHAEADRGETVLTGSVDIIAQHAPLPFEFDASMA